MVEIVIPRRITHALGRVPVNTGSGYLFDRPCPISPQPMSLQEARAVSGDFRVALDFLDHPKTVRLKAAVGAEGIFCLMRLWAFAGNYRPRGILTGMNPDDIALAAKWPGDPDEFVCALVTSKFLDRIRNGGYQLHNWKIRQGYLYHKPERRQKAQKAAKAKHAKADNDLRSAQDKSKHAPLPTPTPLPSPSPSPKIQTPPSAPVTTKKKKETDPRIKVFIDYWYQDYGKVFPGEKYVVQGGKDAAAVKRLLGSASLEEARAAATWFLRLESNDWLGQLGKEINLFAMKYNEIRQRMLAEKGRYARPPA